MTESNRLLELTTQIVSTYVTKNSLPPERLSEVIENTYATLRKLDQQASSWKTLQEPAVPIEESVTPDYIICLEDGGKFKSLKRHLGTRYNLSPEQYREKWGLSSDYPMTSENYAAARSRLARKFGLGQKQKSDTTGNPSTETKNKPTLKKPTEPEEKK